MIDLAMTKHKKELIGIKLKPSFIAASFHLIFGTFLISFDDFSPTIFLCAYIFPVLLYDGIPELHGALNFVRMFFL